MNTLSPEDQKSKMKVEEEIQPTGDGARSKRQEAGTLRELDAAVAERVMGWRNVSSAYLFGNDDGWGGDNPQTPDKGIQDLPHYSTDIKAAMEVVETMRTRGYRWNAQTPQGKGWEIRCYRTTQRGRGEKFRGLLPEAICRAALSLVDSPETKEEEK